MAASSLMSSCVYSQLNNFSTLFQKAISVSSDVTHAESILVSSKDVLLVWDNFSSCFRVTLANAKPTTPLQTLLCSNPPLFPVKSVILNSVEEHVALVGDKGVAIMQMPSKYGSDQLFENGKEKILCKSLMIDERYFCSHHQEKVMKTLWHPGSPNFSILCVLTSDNTLRMYNIAKPESPFQTLSLSGDKFSAALECFVSMTFGSASSSNQHYLTWPLYLLTEMGNVFVANSSVWSPGRLTCEGPLRMFPTAEDNYGSDACDILHLASSPEALVISTVSGSLIHCVLLPGTTDEEDDENLSAEAPLLYVYDIVKLEFLLSTASNSHLADCQDFDFTTQLQLIKDPVKVEYYHCMHSAGVHTVHLPWLFDFQAFAVQEDGATGNDLYAAEKDSKSICQHVLCTQPLSDSKPCPLRGLVVAAEGINQTSLLCLLSNFTCIKVTTRSGPAPHLPEMVSSIVQETHGDVGIDKRMSFDRHIQTLLARDVTNPLIKTGNEQSFSAEQSYNLLARATQISRELHINKLKLARNELDRRVGSLIELKHLQLQELAALTDQRSSLTDVTRNLAEGYEDVLSQHDNMFRRISKVMTAIHHSISSLSEAERSFSSSLVQREQDVDNLQIKLDQVKKKYKFQRESVNKQLDTGPSLSDTQIKGVNGVLTDESQKISELVHQLRSLMSVSQ